MIFTEKKYHHLHGIVPPLKNVRRRRFRKTLKKKPIDLASIEKEVKRLLRMDIEAIDVKWEEVADDAPNAAAGRYARCHGVFCMLDKCVKLLSRVLTHWIQLHNINCHVVRAPIYRARFSKSMVLYTNLDQYYWY